MADVHNKATRSYNMSRIRGKNTKPELIVRKYLHKKGFRYRIHVKNLPGKPDIVLAKYKTIIQVMGCFWHGHDGCRYFIIPRTRTEWWINKISTNILNDTKNDNYLRQQGWNVIHIWECQLKRESILDTLTNLENQLISQDY